LSVTSAEPLAAGVGRVVHVVHPDRRRETTRRA
jgi:hypothetical protein